MSDEKYTVGHYRSHGVPGDSGAHCRHGQILTRPCAPCSDTLLAAENARLRETLERIREDILEDDVTHVRYLRWIDEALALTPPVADAPKRTEPAR